MYKYLFQNLYVSLIILKYPLINQFICFILVCKNGQDTEDMLLFSYILFIFTSEKQLYTLSWSQTQTIFFPFFPCHFSTHPEFRSFTKLFIFEALGSRLKSLETSENGKFPFDTPLILKHVYIPVHKRQLKNHYTKFSFVNMNNSWDLFAGVL